ncbi:hypothetical protein [Treponema primitia]|nr:hypothetical protein [Treponema primitia]
MSVNYFIDPYGYFSDVPPRKDSGDGLVLRNAKLSYIRNHSILYDGFIIGGSRAGVIDPKPVSIYTGLSFYNLFFTGGYQEDYERSIDFLIENTAVKNIFLQIHGREIINGRSLFQHIYAVDSNIPSKIRYYRTILLSDCSTPILNYIIKRDNYPIKNNGMINYFEVFYDPSQKEGMQYVNQKFVNNFREREEYIFIEKSKDDFPDLEYTLDSLVRIRNKCAENNIALTLIVCPSSVLALSGIESPIFWEFLKRVSSITGFYNFNGYSKYNFNPYNYTDETHYRNEVADKMLRIIFNQETPPDDDWGIFLTPENIDEYLERRKNEYYGLKKIYETTGEIPLGDMTDSSFIPLSKGNF